MKNRNLINEVTRIQEMMGVNLITEKVLDYFLKPIIKAGEKAIESAEVKALKSAIESSLDDVLKAVDNPLTKKMETAGIRTIDDLAKIGEKGLTKAEVKKIEKYVADNIIKKLETTGQSDIINKIKLGAFESTPEFAKLKNKTNSIADAWGNGTLSADEFELAKGEVRNLRTTKINLSKSGLNEDELKLMYTEIDTAIAKIEKNITESGGKLEKAGETAATDAIEDEVVNNLESNVEAKIDEVSITIDADKLGDITSQPFTEEEVIKTVLPQLEEDMKLYQKAIWNSTTPQMREKWKLDVTKKTIEATKKAITLADGVIENNVKQLDAMEKIWANPAVDEGFKKRMIEQSLKDLGLKLSPKSWEWWKQGLLKGTGFGSTTPSVKEYMKKFLYINFVWSAIEVSYSIVKTANSPGGQPNPFKDWDAFLAAYHPGDVLIKTFTPFFLGRFIVAGINAGTNEYRIPSSSEVQEFLAKNGVNTPSQYEYKNNETAGTLDVYKGSDILGQYKYNSEKNKVEQFGNVNPELTPSGSSSSNSNNPPAPVTTVATDTELIAFVNKTFPAANDHPTTEQWGKYTFTVDPNDKSKITATNGSITLVCQKQADGSYFLQKPDGSFKPMK